MCRWEKGEDHPVAGAGGAGAGAGPCGAGAGAGLGAARDGAGVGRTVAGAAHDPTRGSPQRPSRLPIYKLLSCSASALLLNCS